MVSGFCANQGGMSGRGAKRRVEVGEGEVQALIALRANGPSAVVCARVAAKKRSPSVDGTR